MGLPRRREFEFSFSRMFMLCCVLFSIRSVSVLQRLICVCFFVVGCCFRAFRPAGYDVDNMVVFLWVFHCSRVGEWVLVGRAHVSRWVVCICCE